MIGGIEEGELERIATRARDRTLDLLLRINTGIEAHTHEFIRTAGDDSKFGLAPRDEARAFDLLHANPWLRLRGVHGHVGSQVYDSEPFAANVESLARTFQRCRAAGFREVDTIVAGGGFGVRMHPSAGDETLDIRKTLRAIRAAAPSGVTLEIEPGRSIVAGAGTSIYRVMAIKRFAERTFAIVDGGMADNPRPALYGAYHHIAAVRDGAHAHPVTVCGRSCENDELGEAMLPADLRAGDTILVQTTGAYTYSMASNYNRFSRPAVVAVRDGNATLWARRETVDDVLRADL